MSNPSGLLAQIQGKAAEVAGDPTRFTGYRDDPVGFARDILGIPELDVEAGVIGLWPRQVECLRAVVDHHSVAIRSGHGVGKTFLMAVLSLWWLYARQGVVITTASSWDQVESVLWQELHSLRAKARVPLPGERNLTQIRVADKWFAQGRSVANPTSFQGLHHTDLLVLIDEAPGIDDPIHDAISSLTVSGGNRRVMVGNPTEMSGAFHRAFQPGSAWHQLHMSCMDHPNVALDREVIPGAVTRRWVDEYIHEYGEDSPIVAARVFGNFPEAGSNQVFREALLDRAMDRERYAEAQADPTRAKLPIVLACDPARYGSNRTVLVQRKGGVIEEIKSWVGQDTTKTKDEIVLLWKATGAVAVIMDEVGLGGPMMDDLIRLGVPMFGYHSGKPARDGVYTNRRAELWMRVRREWFETDKARLPAHPQLRKDLLGAKYSFSKRTFQIVLDAKREMEHSPDFADAVLMAYAWEWEAEFEAPNLYDPARDTNPLPGEGSEELAGGLPSGF